MNVVWHDHEGVQHIVPEDAGIVLHGLDDHVGNRWLAKVEGTAARMVE